MDLPGGFILGAAQNAEGVVVISVVQNGSSAQLISFFPCRCPDKVVPGKAALLRLHQSHIPRLQPGHGLNRPAQISPGEGLHLNLVVFA